MVLMRLESWVERTFFVLPASWSRPAEELPACDALALHRLRWFAVPSLLVAALDLALLAGDGFRASRLGLLGGALVQSLVLLVTSARPVGRTLGHAQKVTHFLSISALAASKQSSLSADARLAGRALQCSASPSPP